MVADLTQYRRLQQEVERANQELETAYEELQSTNEELETTNEELQSTVEELETTNEELQSTNEELETMNEELQSTNEELQTVNDELHRRTDDLHGANRLQNSILASLQAGVIVLDRDLRVRVWNRRSEDQWGLRAEDVGGQHFMNLDLGLPADQMRAELRNCLNGDCQQQRFVVSGTGRRGKQVDYGVTLSPLMDNAKEVSGIVLVVDEVDRLAGEQG